MGSPLIVYAGEWDQAFAGAVDNTRGSMRVTTSSRTGGKKNRGTPRKLATSGLVHVPLCVCGQPADNIAHTGYPKHLFTLYVEAPRG